MNLNKFMVGLCLIVTALATVFTNPFWMLFPAVMACFFQLLSIEDMLHDLYSKQERKDGDKHDQ